MIVEVALVAGPIAQPLRWPQHGRIGLFVAQLALPSTQPILTVGEQLQDIAPEFGINPTEVNRPIRWIGSPRLGGQIQKVQRRHVRRCQSKLRVHVGLVKHFGVDVRAETTNETTTSRNTNQQMFGLSDEFQGKNPLFNLCWQFSPSPLYKISYACK